LIGCGDGALPPLPLPYQADPGGGTTAAQASMNQAVQVICQKLVNCGILKTSLATCVKEASKILKEFPLPYFLDMSQYAGCIQQMECYWLTSVDLDKTANHPIKQCTGIDYANMTCIGPSSLKVCNVSSVCQSINCSQVCAAISVKYINGKCKSSKGGAYCSCSGSSTSPPKPDYGTKKDSGVKKDAAYSKDYGEYVKPDGGLPY